MTTQWAFIVCTAIVVLPCVFATIASEALHYERERNDPPKDGEA